MMVSGNRTSRRRRHVGAVTTLAIDTLEARRYLAAAATHLASPPTSGPEPRFAVMAAPEVQAPAVLTPSQSSIDGTFLPRPTAHLHATPPFVVHGKRSSEATLRPHTTVYARAPAADPSLRSHPLETLQRTTIAVGRHLFRVWVMDTESKRREGMMFLRAEDMQANEGMLFVFKEPRVQRFWMKDTFIPLDISYISASGRVLNTARGRPLDLTSLPSAGKALYVLETKAGTMQQLRIGPRAVVRIPSDLQAPSPAKSSTFLPPSSRSVIPGTPTSPRDGRNPVQRAVPSGYSGGFTSGEET